MKSRREGWRATRADGERATAPKRRWGLVPRGAERAERTERTGGLGGGGREDREECPVLLSRDRDRGWRDGIRRYRPAAKLVVTSGGPGGRRRAAAVRRALIHRALMQIVVNAHRLIAHARIEQSACNEQSGQSGISCPETPAHRAVSPESGSIHTGAVGITSRRCERFARGEKRVIGSPPPRQSTGGLRSHPASGRALSGAGGSDMLTARRKHALIGTS